MNLDSGVCVDDLISGEVKYTFSLVEDDEIKTIVYSQSSIIGTLGYYEQFVGNDEMYKLSKKINSKMYYNRFLSIASEMRLIDGLLIEMVYTASEFKGMTGTLEYSFTNSLLQDNSP